MVGFGVPADIRHGCPATAPERKGIEPKARSEDPPNGVERIAVLVIDDRTMLGQSLAAAINASTSDISVTHRTTQQALADLPAAFGQADIVLVCVGRAGLVRGAMARTLKRLLAEQPHPPIAILADRTEPSAVDAAMRLNLRGILSSTAPLSTVIDSLRRIHQGATVVPGRS